MFCRISLKIDELTNICHSQYFYRQHFMHTDCSVSKMKVYFSPGHGIMCPLLCLLLAYLFTIGSYLVDVSFSSTARMPLLLPASYFNYFVNSKLPQLPLYTLRMRINAICFYESATNVMFDCLRVTLLKEVCSRDK